MSHRPRFGRAGVQPSPPPTAHLQREHSTCAAPWQSDCQDQSPKEGPREGHPSEWLCPHAASSLATAGPCSVLGSHSSTRHRARLPDREEAPLPLGAA